MTDTTKDVNPLKIGLAIEPGEDGSFLVHAHRTGRQWGFTSAMDMLAWLDGLAGRNMAVSGAITVFDRASGIPIHEGLTATPQYAPRGSSMFGGKD